jgi:hypothetical protein
MTGTPTFSHGKGRHMHLHQRCGTTGKVSEWEYPGVTPNQSNTAESGAVNGTAAAKLMRWAASWRLEPPVIIREPLDTEIDLQAVAHFRVRSAAALARAGDPRKR